MNARDFSDVRGNDDAVTSVARAVITRRGALLVGPPGAGKTMIAARSPGLLGPLSDHERAWLTAEYVGTRLLDIGQEIVERPFRAPHYTISIAALTAGRMPCGAADRMPASACRCKQLIGTGCIFHQLPRGPVPPAGEARLARFGVLYLDEIVEFSRTAIEQLRVTLKEMGGTAPVLLASAMRCPCGWDMGPWAPNVRQCSCTEAMRSRYQARVEWAVSRLPIDSVASVHQVALADQRAAAPGWSTEMLRQQAGGAS